MASERDIINTLIAEALGEGPEGMRRVAETILNRSQIRGMTPEQVVTQPYQYTGYEHPGPAAVAAQSDPNAITAAEAAWQLAQQPDDPTNGADHYFNPNVVQPSWARSMTPTGDYGGHSFYSSQPVPQRQAMVAPTPASPSASVTASRAVTSPSGGNTALQSALARLATVKGNAVTPQVRSTPVAQSTRQPAAADLSAMQRNVVTPYMSGSDMYAADFFGMKPTLPNGQATLGKTTYAGQDRTAQADPWKTIATIPTAKQTTPTSDAARRAVLSMSGTQTYAGQSGSPQAVGKAPATRVVQSVPMPAISQAKAVPLSTGVGQSYAGQDRAVPARKTVLPTQSQLVAATGFTGPVPDRLPTGFNIPNTTNARGIAGVGANAVAPIPYSRPAAMAPQNAVASALSAQQAPVPMQMSSRLANMRQPVPSQAIQSPIAQALVQPQQQQQRAPLRVVVNGGMPAPAQAQVNPVAAALAQIAKGNLNDAIWNQPSVSNKNRDGVSQSISG